MTEKIKINLTEENESNNIEGRKTKTKLNEKKNNVSQSSIRLINSRKEKRLYS